MALRLACYQSCGETTKNFKLVVGAGGLEKTIDCTEILDFGFDDEINYRKKKEPSTETVSFSQAFI